MKTELYVELNDRQVECGQFTEKVKDIWKASGNRVKDMKSVQIYYKPTESAVYYVINGTERGKFTV